MEDDRRLSEVNLSLEYRKRGRDIVALFCVCWRHVEFSFRPTNQLLGEFISSGFVVRAPAGSSGMFHPGSSCEPVMRRTPSLKVRYVQAHWRKTEMRLRKPIRKKIWTTSQVIQAGKPLQWALNGHSIFATAALRPMVAMSPLSK